MTDQMFGLREIYNCVIRATYDIEVDGRIITAGEPIAVLDSVQMANFQEIKDRVEARGGYNNQSWIAWESTESIQMNFTQGVFSKLHFALLGNSTISTTEVPQVPMEEFGVEVSEEKMVQLKYAPVGEIYVYNQESGDRLEFIQDGQELLIPDAEAYSLIDIYYTFESEKSAKSIILGRQLFNGYLTLTAKTRLKDDSTGKTVTGIFRVPRLKLVSDFSIQLGNNVPPSIGNFKMAAIPTGSKGSEMAMEFIVLATDIDSDI